MVFKAPILDMQASGLQIKKLMEQANLNPRKLQKLLNFASVQAIYRWFKGETMPNLDALLQLSKILNKSINEILVCTEIEREISE